MVSYKALNTIEFNSNKVLIEPLWNWNWPYAHQGDLQFGINRTFMELKYEIADRQRISQEY